MIASDAVFADQARGVVPLDGQFQGARGSNLRISLSIAWAFFGFAPSVETFHAALEKKVKFKALAVYGVRFQDMRAGL